ncbi:matrixin family metalloprotease [Pseudomonas chlororaphis]|nr:matrixin family metalloprotease [Pseudomonas chlororaphis]
MSQSAPSATLNDLATAAVASYGGPDTPVMGSQWTPIDVAPAGSALAGDMSSYGFSGQAYVNSQTGEVIIADRGTTGNVQNIISDTNIALTTPNGAQQVANNFAEAALVVAQDQLKDLGVAVSAIYTTGHSLGGAESQGQTATLSVAVDSEGTPLLPSDVRITNVSFDAPGIAGLSTIGDSSKYTSYNFSAQGDVIHLSGGSDLAGTTDVSLAVGPSMWATGGMIGLGATIQNIPGGGTALGAALIADGLSNALDAHSSALLQNKISETALGQTELSQMSGMSATQMQNTFGVTQTNAPVYDAAGYDQNGYNTSGYSIYGINQNGDVDPSIAAQGGRTNTDTLSDGSKVTVVIAKDGSTIETLNNADGVVYTYSSNASGDLIKTTTQNADGTTFTQSIDPSTDVITQSTTDKGGVVEEGATIQENQDGSADAISTIYNGSGQKSVLEVDQRSINGSSSESDTNYNNNVAQGQVVIYSSATEQPNTVAVTGTGSAVDLNNGTITLAAGAQATLSGSDNNITADTNASVSLASGSSWDVVTMMKAGEVILASADDDITVHATGSYVSMGMEDRVALIGSVNTVTGGAGDTLTVAGSDTVSLTSGGTVTETAASANLTVNGDNVSSTATGQNDALTATGNNASATTTGNGSLAETTGIDSKAVTTGADAEAFTTGVGSEASTTGASSEAYTTGSNAEAYTTGIGSTAITAGYDSLAVTIGAGSQASTSGNDSEAYTTGSGAEAYTSGLGSTAYTSGYDSLAVTIGAGSLSSTSGNDSEAYTSGVGAEAYTSGLGSTATTAGYDSLAITIGASSLASTVGNDSEASTSGAGAEAYTSGLGSTATTAGYDSLAVTVGASSLASTVGNDSEAYTTGTNAEAYTAGTGSTAYTAGYDSLAVTIGAKSLADTVGNDSEAYTTGADSEASTAGGGSEAETFGTGAEAYTAGIGATATTAGYDSLAVTIGASSLASTSGNDSEAYTSGAGAEAYTSGLGSIATTAGYDSLAVTIGADSLASTVGNDSEAYTTGTDAEAYTSGAGSEAGTTGGGSEAYTLGHDSIAATSGNSSEAYTAGTDAEAYTAGTGSEADTVGAGSEAYTAGNDSLAETSGANSLAYTNGIDAEAYTTGLDSEAHTIGADSLAETTGVGSNAVTAGSGAEADATGGGSDLSSSGDDGSTSTSPPDISSNPGGGDIPTDPVDPPDLPPGGYDGGGYGFAGSKSTTLSTTGSNIGFIAQYDLNQGNKAAAAAAEKSLQQAVDTAISTPTTGSGSAVLDGAKFDQQVITWSLAGSQGTQAAPFSGYMGSADESVVQGTFNTWAASMPGVAFEEVSDSAQSDVRVGFGDFNTATTGIIGYTSYQANDGQIAPDAIVRVEDPTQNALTTGADGQQTYAGTEATLSQVLLHEIGHALGLADNADQNSVMNYQLTANNRTLDGTDLVGIGSLYGSGSSTASVGSSGVSQLIQAMSTFNADTGVADTTLLPPALLNNNVTLSASAHAA